MFPAISFSVWLLFLVRARNLHFQLIFYIETLTTMAIISDAYISTRSYFSIDIFNKAAKLTMRASQSSSITLTHANG